MRCYHCKRAIGAGETRTYISYRTRWDGPLRRRYWCAECSTDSITDAEAPNDWTERAGLWVPPSRTKKQREAVCQ